MRPERKQLLIGTAIGLFLPALFWMVAYGITSLSVQKDIVTEHLLELIYLKYLKVAVLVNLLPFMYFIRKEKDEICKGILMGTIITGAVFAVIILTSPL